MTRPPPPRALCPFLRYDFVIASLRSAIRYSQFDTRHQVNQGDRILFFTDGLTETMDANSEMLGTDGLARIATTTCSGTVSDMADCILERVAAFRSGLPQDDMTLILAELK